MDTESWGRTYTERRPGARAAWLSWAWSMKVGSVVALGRTAAPILAIDNYPPGSLRPPGCPALPGEHARRWHTTRGDRWITWATKEAIPPLPPQEGLF